MTEYAPSPTHRCPTCDSRYPERHPSMGFEWEVEICVDDFHLIPTNCNAPAYIAAVHAKRAMLAARQDPHPCK